MRHRLQRLRFCARQIAAVAVTTAIVAGCAATMPATLPHPLIMKTPAVVEGRSLDGRIVRMPTTGMVTVIDFWATWCKPCLEMMPAMEDIHRTYHAKGVIVVGVAADDNPGLVANRLRSFGTTYPNVLDDNSSSLQGAYKVTDLPRTFVHDKRGRVRLVVGQESDATDKIKKAVEVLLNEREEQ